MGRDAVAAGGQLLEAPAVEPQGPRKSGTRAHQGSCPRAEVARQRERGAGSFPSGSSALGRTSFEFFVRGKFGEFHPSKNATRVGETKNIA